MIQDRRDAVLYFLLEKDLLYLRKKGNRGVCAGREKFRLTVKWLDSLFCIQKVYRQTCMCYT